MNKIVTVAYFAYLVIVGSIKIFINYINEKWYRFVDGTKTILK